MEQKVNLWPCQSSTRNLLGSTFAFDLRFVHVLHMHALVSNGTNDLHYPNVVKIWKKSNVPVIVLAASGRVFSSIPNKTGISRDGTLQPPHLIKISSPKFAYPTVETVRIQLPQQTQGCHIASSAKRFLQSTLSNENVQNSNTIITYVQNLHWFHMCQNIPQSKILLR